MNATYGAIRNLDFRHEKGAAKALVHVQYIIMLNLHLGGPPHGPDHPANCLRWVGSHYCLLADWTSGARHYRALAVLNQRLASGEIDQTEYEEKRKLIKSK